MVDLEDFHVGNTQHMLLARKNPPPSHPNSGNTPARHKSTAHLQFTIIGMFCSSLTVFSLFFCACEKLDDFVLSVVFNVWG